MEDFEKSLKLGFIDEALQLIEEFETLLLDLEQNPSKKETIDGVFRIVHNIKGSSKAVGFENLGVFCHELETYMLEIKNGSKQVNTEVIDKLLFSKDVITSTLFQHKSNLELVVDLSAQIEKLKIESSRPADVTNVESDSFTQEPLASENSREASNGETSFDSQNQEENLNSYSGFVENKNVTIKKRMQAGTAGDESVRVNLKRVDHLINAVGELVVLQAVLKEQILTNDNHSKTYRTADELSKIIKEVQDLSMSLRMVPAKSLVQKLQRICRDTSAGLNKDVKFNVKGEDAEIDKTILDMISDPLVHIVRNAVDHGLESEEDRIAQGKKTQGELNLSIGYEGGKLLIRVKDDGGGLNKERITAKAVEKGIIKEGAVLSEQQIHELIFAPGFSTKQNVTEVSGRGVGMDVVKTSVEALGGQIEIKSQFKMGTEFIIQLPLTLAIIEGMVVKIGTNQFVLPLAQVSETFKVDAQQMDGQAGNLFCLRGKDFPIFNLTKILYPKAQSSGQGGIGILSHSGRFSFVVVVEDIIGQQQIVIKQIGAELSHLNGYIGSAILGDGKPALILDLVDLVDKAQAA